MTWCSCTGRQRLLLSWCLPWRSTGRPPRSRTSASATSTRRARQITRNLTARVSVLCACEVVWEWQILLYCSLLRPIILSFVYFLKSTEAVIYVYLSMSTGVLSPFFPPTMSSLCPFFFIPSFLSDSDLLNLLLLHHVQSSVIRNDVFLTRNWTSAGIFRSNSFFIGSNCREAVNDGRADCVPIFLSEIPLLFHRRIINIDVALVQVRPAFLFCALGSVFVKLSLFFIFYFYFFHYCYFFDMAWRYLTYIGRILKMPSRHVCLDTILLTGRMVKPSKCQNVTCKFNEI